tara:strand:- start:3559 stop:3972 length:414 start_codon:yes stop_codon:yes gene_type:complete
MRTNFDIEENYAVTLNGVHIDLHNNFVFCEISESENIVEVDFVRSKGNWVHENEFKRLKFCHKNVSFKNTLEGDNIEYPEDENILSVISFFPKTMRDINDGFRQNSKPDKDDDIIYLFENGKMIRLNCDNVELIAKK